MSYKGLWFYPGMRYDDKEKRRYYVVKYVNIKQYIYYKRGPEKSCTLICQQNFVIAWRSKNWNPCIENILSVRALYVKHAIQIVYEK